MEGGVRGAVAMQGWPYGEGQQELPQVAGAEVGGVARAGSALWPALFPYASLLLSTAVEDTVLSPGLE